MSNPQNMADMPSQTPPARSKTNWQGAVMQARIRKRYAAERRFKAMGFAAVALSSIFLAFLLFSMLSNGLNGFRQTQIAVTLDFPALSGGTRADTLKGSNPERAVMNLDPQGMTDLAVSEALGDRAEAVLSRDAWVAVRDALIADPALVEQKAEIWLPATAEFDRAYKDGDKKTFGTDIAALEKQDKVKLAFNSGFLTNSDGTNPASVGIWGAFKGSLFTMIVTLLLAFPIGVLAALYLEEYAPRNRFSDMIEVSINNLAAVPSIIFGLLGLVVFLEWMDLPRSSALVGGLTLALMTMPVIVIAGRNAIKSVPPSIREAALGVGASPVQVVFHHVLPLAIPGIMTGTIIGMARALGETAPLLMVGMRAFTATPPESLTSPSTVLPVQIYLWSDEVNRSFVEKTSAAILVLLVFLMAMNATAIYLRNRFETRW